MTPSRQTLISRRAERRQSRTLSGLICVFALLLQVILPTTAQASGGIWVEICGEFGAQTVLMDVSGDDPAPAEPAPCPDCGPCVLCAVAPLVILPDMTITHSDTQAFLTRFQAIAADVPPNDAQFWPDNRGPPLRHAFINTLDLPSMALPRISTGGARS